MWDGYRITLNCAHLLLTDLVDQDRLQIGQLTTCDMCPLTVHNPDAPGRPTRAVRLVVNRESVRALATPLTVDPAYWYGT